jgi:hypothetical protein
MRFIINADVDVEIDIDDFMVLLLLLTVGWTCLWKWLNIGCKFRAGDIYVFLLITLPIIDG